MSDDGDRDRRKFLKLAGASGAAAILAGCGEPAGDEKKAGAPAILSRKRSLKMVTSWPKNYPGAGTGAERLARRLSELTDGSLEVKVFAAGELVPAFGGFDAVASGKADLYHGAEYYWQGRSKAFNFFAAIPFGMTTTELAAWIYWDGGQELWDALSAPFGIKPFMAGSTGPQMGGWYRKEINSVEDFKGLRIRMPGLGGEVMERLGATPVTKAGGEIFLALSQGNIDATEWIGPWNDLAFGFHTIVDYYYWPGIHEPGTALGMGVNRDLWEDLAPAQRAAIENAAAAETIFMRSEYEAQNARALKTLIEEHGVKLRRFSDDILAEMGRVAGEVLADVAAGDELTGEIYRSYRASMGRTARWGEISERAFAAARDRLGS